MNEVSCLKLIEETLAEKWGTYEKPLCMDLKDLKAGVALFTKIAMESINQKFAVKKSEFTLKHSTDPLSTLDDKLKRFVEKKAHAFRKACETGFPFSLFESSRTEIALKHALKHHDSIVSCFMTLEGSAWLGEEELDKCFGNAFQYIKAREIGKACFDLKRAYVNNGDNKAGYYLLWLIKQSAGCSFEMPTNELFNASTVGDVLSQFFSESSHILKPANFVELLHYRSCKLDQPLYVEFLNQHSCIAFIFFAIEQLTHISMDAWPSKTGIIIDLLETLTTESKLPFAMALSSSADCKTSEVGDHLFKALLAPSLRKGIPHFNALLKLLPDFNETHIEIIFGRPFIEFRQDKFIYKKDPDFTKRLQFNDMKTVFIRGPLMMGVYAPRATYGGVGIPPYLLAYDINTEKLVWGIPLTPQSPTDLSLDMGTPITLGMPRMGSAAYTLKSVGNHISHQFRGEQKVRLIDPETGEFNSIIELPEPSNNAADYLHISSEGFAYQIVNKNQSWTLVGGKLVDGKWNSSFKTKAPYGLFRSLSTHFGILETYENTLILFGPTGDRQIIKNCLAAEARDDKLYLIEKDPICADKCLFTVRTLKVGHEVVSTLKKSISLAIKKASFGDLCKNGQWILFSHTLLETLPLFVDLQSENVIYSDHHFPRSSKHTINCETGDLWSWEEASQNIWKISSTTRQLMGKLESGSDLTLVHVDKNDNLYFLG